MGTEPQATSKWMYVSIALIVIIVAQTALFSYVLIDLNRTISGLKEKQDALNSDFASLETSLNRLQGDTTRPQVSDASLPSAGLTPVQIYELSKDSVVLITTKIQTSSGLFMPFTSGSGFVYDRDGHIVTNHHVIEDGDAIDVTFSEGTIVPAKVVGTDPYSDLAVLQVDWPSDLLEPLPLGPSSELLVGERVMAIGNPFGLSNSMSGGIVSQMDRDLDAPGNFKIIDVIQVDAAINPGNSGGPLMNMYGEVVGVNTAIIQGGVGVGFAIPSDTVSREVPQLIQTGEYTHPWIGVTAVNLDPDMAEELGLNVTKGTLVVSVAADSPAEAVGIKGGEQGDVIVGIDTVAVRKLIDVLVYIERNNRPGDTVTLTIIRNGEFLDVDVTLDERPPP
jgi:S1-C subfamily serine protease